MKIAIINGAGNMLSVGLPLAHNLSNQGVTPVFAVRGSGRYRTFFERGSPFKVVLADRTDEDKVIQSYCLYPITSVMQIGNEPLPFCAFRIAPVEILPMLAEMPDIQLAAAFVSVGAGNITAAVGEVKAGLAADSVLPVYLLENLSSEKEGVLKKYAKNSNVKAVNCVIRRTSSDWRVNDGVVFINTRDSGSVKYGDVRGGVDLLPLVDGVEFIRTPQERIAREDAVKFFGTNFVDYLIARYLAKKIFVDYESDFLFDGHPRLSHCEIDGLIHVTEMQALETMITVINHRLTEEFGEAASSAYRIDVMRREKLGRILKTDKSSHLSKLEFCRQKAVGFLRLNEFRTSALAHSAKYAEGVANIKFTLGL